VRQSTFLKQPVTSEGGLLADYTHKYLGDRKAVPKQQGASRASPVGRESVENKPKRKRLSKHVLPS
jgi:hypothetical protein